jgi:hypothetical protein
MFVVDIDAVSQIAAILVDAHTRPKLPHIADGVLVSDIHVASAGGEKSFFA